MSACGVVYRDVCGRSCGARCVVVGVSRGVSKSRLTRFDFRRRGRAARSRFSFAGSRSRISFTLERPRHLENVIYVGSPPPPSKGRLRWSTPATPRSIWNGGTPRQGATCPSGWGQPRGVGSASRPTGWGFPRAVGQVRVPPHPRAHPGARRVPGRCSRGCRAPHVAGCAEGAPRVRGRVSCRGVDSLSTRARLAVRGCRAWGGRVVLFPSLPPHTPGNGPRNGAGARRLGDRSPTRPRGAGRASRRVGGWGAGARAGARPCV